MRELRGTDPAQPHDPHVLAKRRRNRVILLRLCNAGEPKMTPKQRSGLSTVIEVVMALNAQAPRTLDKILDRMDLDTDELFEELRNVATLLGDDA